MSTWGFADAMYGALPNGVTSGATSLQPGPDVAGAAPSQQVAGKPHLLAQPTFWVVALVAVAIGLVHASFRLA